MISNEQLKQVLVEQYDSILSKDTGVKREALAEISAKIKLPHIHVITGLRRCGKSTFLRQIIHEYYHDTGFYYINFEDERLYNFSASDFNVIYELLLQLFGKNKVFFIDEIQNVNNFENFVRRFYDDGFKFFISGSNANLLSSEIATKLTGRHIDTHITPFSFTEFLTFSNIKYSQKSLYKSEKKAEIINAFDVYLKQGGMPEYIKYQDREILTRTYNDIVLKDIVARYKLESVHQLKMLFSYMVNNYARRYSYNSLRKIVNLGSSNTIINFLSYLEQTFFLTQITKFDYSLKKQIANEKKSYIVDNGFITSISAVLTKDEGWLLENLVFIELNKTNETVYYYSDKNECDFITINNGKLNQAIQVTSAISPSNKDREINGLIDAMDKLNMNDGIVLSKETEKTIKTDKHELSIIPVWKWLLQKNAK